jgi:hypothetical protein
LGTDLFSLLAGAAKRENRTVPNFRA